MTNKTLSLTHERLKELLEYDQKTGLFTRKVARGMAKEGKVAGHSTGRYIGITLDYVHHQAHRLAWFYVTGEWPSGCIDHINRVKTDNRFSNLRVVTASENAHNVKPKKGYWKNHRGKKWTSVIVVRGNGKYLGLFETEEMAREAYFKAKAELHPAFSENP